MFVLYNRHTLNGTAVPFRKREVQMRTKDQELLTNIQSYIEDYCDKHGYGPTVRDIADELGISSTNTHRSL